jgi:small redox-active disulfide protein 2
MKKIHILGTGCSKCNALTTAVQQAVATAGIPAEIEKVTDILRFADFGVMMTPALVVDGVVKATGRVPSPDELKKLLA